MARRSTGKRLRFEILKRDGFRCRYCGATSMDALLHVDHVVPVADGGDDSPENLAASCAACNGGKSSVPLTESSLGGSPRADAMKEHAAQVKEMLKAARALSKAQAEYIALVVEECRARIGHIPDDCMPGLRSATGRHPFADLVRAMDIVMTKASVNGWSPHNAARYFFGILRNYREDGKCV